MSDERLRELERIARQTGSLEDHAALVRARLRVGLTTSEKVAFAAFLRNEVAAKVRDPLPSAEVDREVLEGLSGPLPTLRRLAPFASWAQTLEQDRDVSLRTAIAVIRWSLSSSESALGGPSRRRRRARPGIPVAWDPYPGGLNNLRNQLREVLDAAELLALDRSHQNTIRLLRSCASRVPAGRALAEHLFLVGFATADELPDREGDGKGWLVQMCVPAVTSSRRVVTPVMDKCPRGHRTQGEGYTPCWRCLFETTVDLQNHVRVELVPWLLGDGDPLAKKERHD